MSKKMSKKSKEIKEQKQWRVGEYLRLSKEDLTEGTSVSIDHQQSIIHNFINEDPLRFELVETYVSVQILWICRFAPGFSSGTR